MMNPKEPRIVPTKEIRGRGCIQDLQKIGNRLPRSQDGTSVIHQTQHWTLRVNRELKIY